MNHQPCLLAIGFTNLAMLGWLSAAAAPLLIHLWSRHRFREAPWAAMQFLLAAMRKNARRLRLQQWLLLALRTLLIVLVVLAVAQPYGEQLVAGSSAGPAHRVIILDGSYSMAYRAGDSTNFERAKHLSADLVRQSNIGDTLSVIVMASPPRKVFRQEHGNFAKIASHIESLRQTHTGADLDATLAIVEAEIMSDENSVGSTRRREVYFFTDLQRSTWSPSSPLHDGERGGARAPVAAATGRPRAKNTSGDALQEFFSRVAKSATFHLIDIRQPSDSNVAITHFSAAEPFAIANRDVPFDVTLREFGGNPRSRHTVELEVDDIPVAEQTLDIPADGEATVRFPHRFDSTGEHKLAVRTAEDGLAVDNARFLVVPVREKLHVLCVEGHDGAARYVAEALTSSAGVDSTIEPTVVSESGLADTDLAEFDSIFMCNVAQLTDGEATRLTNYAANGGGIVFFLGDQVIADSYNKFSAPGGSGRATASSQRIGALIPARIAEITSNSQFGIDPLGYNHPIVTPFRGQERAGLLTTPVSRYYKLEPPPEQHNAEVAASLHGDPFIVSAPIGRGRTIIVATDASLTSVDQATSEPWTLWPTWPSFLPMIRELLAYALAGRQLERQRPVGAALGGPLPNGLPSSGLSEIQMARPDGQKDAVSIDSSSDQTQWSYGDTLISGIYSLNGIPKNTPHQFAMNVETNESDLAKANASELPPELNIGVAGRNASSSDSANSTMHAAWHEPLLLGALALMLLESLLAWQFGRGGV